MCVTNGRHLENYHSWVGNVHKGCPAVRIKYLNLRYLLMLAPTGFCSQLRRQVRNRSQNGTRHIRLFQKKPACYSSCQLLQLNV